MNESYLDRDFREARELVGGGTTQYQGRVSFSEASDGRYVVMVNDLDTSSMDSPLTSDVLKGLPFTTNQIAVLVATNFQFDASSEWKELLAVYGRAVINEGAEVPKLVFVQDDLVLKSSTCSALEVAGGDLTASGDWSCANLVALGGGTSWGVDPDDLRASAPRLQVAEIGWERAKEIGIVACHRSLHTARATDPASALLDDELDVDADAGSIPGLSL